RLLDAIEQNHIGARRGCWRDRGARLQASQRDGNGSGSGQVQRLMTLAPVLDQGKVRSGSRGGLLERHVRIVTVENPNDKDFAPSWCGLVSRTVAQRQGRQSKTPPGPLRPAQDSLPERHSEFPKGLNVACGNSTRISVPAPSSLSAYRRQPKRSHRRRTMDRPSP